MGASAMLRLALERQLRQSVLAAAVAAATLVAWAPVAVGIRGCVALAAEQHAPLGEVTLTGIAIMAVTTVAEEIGSTAMRGTARLGRLYKVLAVHAVIWVAATLVAKQLGVQDLTTLSVPLALGIYMIAGPLVVLLTPGQSCTARLRRIGRELALGALRVTFSAAGGLIIAYTYLTVFTELEPALEVTVLGMGMPVAQAACMSLMAWLVSRRERAMRRGALRKSVEPREERAEEHSGAPWLENVMVLTAEQGFATCAFISLALAESDETFLVSLVSMLCIEVVQVTVHVKARRIMTRVVNEDAANTVLGDNTCIRDWLLHQELGEKIGLLFSLGLLAIDMTLGRELPATQASRATFLARRGAVMVVLELVSDLGKDLVSQALGVMPSAERAARVSLPRVALLFVVSLGLAAGLCAQVGLAFGT